jgi:hypothetical protein
MASSKLVGEVALISDTLATDIVPPSRRWCAFCDTTIYRRSGGAAIPGATAEPARVDLHVPDYTPLHMAVAERNVLAIRILLDAGADRERRTRIDECETPLEMAKAAGLADIAAMLARR